MYYITAASTISHQVTFKNKGFSLSIKVLEGDSQLLTPNFKEYINPSLIRRMTEILRTSITCSLDCLTQKKIVQPDAIIVGTGLGCLNDTEKFLNEYTPGKEGAISPTAFIQSTHNTIGGQISLILGNHSYNMTHTQNTLSFEHALTDAMLNVDEGKENVLVGAADEYTSTLNKISSEFGFQNLHLTSGASFFILTGKNENALAKITDVVTLGAVFNLPEKLKYFLDKNSIKSDEIDMVLFSSLSEENIKVIHSSFAQKIVLDHSKYSGIYFTNSAFALHYAVDTLQSQRGVKKILIFNNLNKNSLGLTLIEKL